MANEFLKRNCSRKQEELDRLKSEGEFNLESWTRFLVEVSVDSYFHIVDIKFVTWHFLARSCNAWQAVQYHMEQLIHLIPSPSIGMTKDEFEKAMWKWDLPTGNQMKEVLEAIGYLSRQIGGIR